MGKKKTKQSSNSKRKKKSSNNKPASSSSLYANFVSEAGPGCYIARRDASPPWLLEWEDVDPNEFSTKEEIPDVAIDTDENTLSVCNIDECHKVAYVTVYETKVVGADGVELRQGISTDNQGVTQSCATFIVLCPPRVFVHLCVLAPTGNKDIVDVKIESDVSRWQQHPKPNDEHPFRIGFPLGKIPVNGGDSDNMDSENPSFLCTQGENGELTHFFSGNLHAIDFQCPVGTELLAVADGIVTDAKDSNTLTGISVNNLFEWNSIILQYVHIQRSLVKVGQVIKKGQVIGYSGSVGFSPEPHLHFSAFRSSDPTAPTVRVLFDGEAGNDAAAGAGHEAKPFLPRAGKQYNTRGLLQI
ncbi:MAG: hypothetical protein SGARI_005273 [Bacillariaceae sp.]